MSELPKGDFTQWLESPQDRIAELKQLARSFEWARKELEAEARRWKQTSDFQLGTW